MENPFEIINQRLESIERLLNELRSDHNNSVENKHHTELMNVSQVAEYLSLAPQTIYGLVSKREIPNCKRGKRLYFKKSDINEWITLHHRKSNAEIEAEALSYLTRKRNSRYSQQ